MVQDNVFEKAVELGEDPKELAKKIFLDYIQERTVKTPSPEELIDMICSLKEKAMEYYGTNQPSIDNQLVCKWVCEKFKISPKQFFNVIVKALNSEYNIDQDGHYKLGVARGWCNRSTDIILHGIHYRFISFHNKRILEI